MVRAMGISERTVRTLAVIVILVAFIAMVSLEVGARSHRVAQVPNGGDFSCNLCHTSGGGSSRNPFGQTVESSYLVDGNVDWGPALAAVDSDGDGFTNGEELGDPDGDGSATPGVTAYHPGDASSHPPVGSAPDTPVMTTVSMTDTDGDYYMNWSGVADSDSYTLSENGVAVYTGTSASYHVTGRDNGTYDYVVVATNEHGDSSPGAIVTVTVDIPPWVPDTPQFPSTRMTDTDGNITISWNAVERGELYHVFEKGMLLWSGPSTSIEIVGIQSGGYHFSVLAQNEGGLSGISVPLVVTVLREDPSLDASDFIDDASSDATDIILMNTTHGVIVMELYGGVVGSTVNNFLAYANDGYLEGLIFHRVIDGFMIQGGGFAPGMDQMSATYSPIPLEIDGTLRHIDGAVSMARTSDPDSATSQFFICDGPQVFLDDNYAVFGQVISGMDVVRSISAVQTGSVSNGMTDVPMVDVLIVQTDVHHIVPSYPEIPVMVTQDMDDRDGDFVIEWEAAGNASGYTLTENGTMVYSDSGLAYHVSGREDGVYEYQVRSFNSYGTSSYSDPLLVTVNTTLPPVSFTDVRVENLTSSTVRVLSLSNISIECEVQYGVGGFYSLARDPDMMVATMVHDVPIAGLTPNTTYVYRFVAYRGTPYETYSVSGNFTTLPEEEAEDVGEAYDLSVVATSSNWAGGDMDSSFGGNKAIDGDMNTAWSSNGDGDDAWIEVSLGETGWIAGVGFASRTMTTSSFTDSVEVLVDGVSVGIFPVAEPLVLYGYTFNESISGDTVRFEVNHSNGGNTGAMEVAVYKGNAPPVANATEWMEWNISQAIILNQTQWHQWNLTVLNQTQWQEWNLTVLNQTQWHQWNLTVLNQTQWQEWNATQAQLQNWTELQEWNLTVQNRTEMYQWNLLVLNRTEWMAWNESVLQQLNWTQWQQWNATQGNSTVDPGNGTDDPVIDPDNEDESPGFMPAPGVVAVVVTLVLVGRRVSHEPVISKRTGKRLK